MKKKTITVHIGENKNITFETGEVARQAGGSVLVKSNETVVFSSVCSSELNEETDFLPLRVDYQEKFSSAGKTLGGFIKREGRPSEKEILTSRLIDRSLRPAFPEGIQLDIQALSYVWSYDGETLPDPLAICAASAAVVISDIPLASPLAGVRVGMVNGSFIVNPTNTEMKESTLDLVLSGTKNAILMIEGHCNFLSEETILKAIDFGHQSITQICESLEKWQKDIGKEKKTSSIISVPEAVLKAVEEQVLDQIKDLLPIKNKKVFEASYKKIETATIDNLYQEDSIFSKNNIKIAYKKISSKYMRTLIKQEGIRSDGRNITDIRPIFIEPSFLPRSHGSCLFTRGETQTLAVCTLGSETMGQRFEDLNGEGLSKFYLQYSFPPFSVGEVGRVGSPGRREIGHGKLAEKSLSYILPSTSLFPYTIRLESNITESNGSSSMASVCGGCLAMMDAGVPISNPIAGIAMGLILDDQEAVVLSDISGIEDHLGDMDFKIAGSEEGITAFQMDIKVEGITKEIMAQALEQAKQGRHEILEKMNLVLNQPKSEMSQYAPRIETIQVKPSKIATIIGPGGKQIRKIIEETGVQIDINDQGLVSITSSNKEAMNHARSIIEGLVGDAEVGKIYKGKVTSVVAFGAFVEILPGKEGLCHISELDKERVASVTDVVQEGDIIEVKLLSINEKGQLKLSRKAIL